MFYTAFREPCPATTEEMDQVFNNACVDPVDCDAYVVDNRESEAHDRPFYGWTADILTKDEGLEVFSTLGFLAQEALVTTMRAAGVTNVTVLVGEDL